MTAFPGDDLDDESTVVVLPGDTPLLRPRRSTTSSPPTSPTTRGHGADLGAGRPDRLRADRPRRRTAGCCASSSSATRAAEEREIDEVNTSIYAFRRDLLGPALRHLSPDNAQGEYYLTDVIGVLAGMGHRVGCVKRRGRRDAGRQRSLAAGARRARAAVAHQPALAAQRRHDARSAPDVHRRHRRPRARRHAVSRARCCTATTVVGDGCEIGPNTRLIDCKVGSGRRSSTPSGRRRRSAPGPGRAVRRPAAGLGRRGRRGHRCLLHCTQDE